MTVMATTDKATSTLETDTEVPVAAPMPGAHIFSSSSYGSGAMCESGGHSLTHQRQHVQRHKLHRFQVVPMRATDPHQPLPRGKGSYGMRRQRRCR